MTSKEQQNAWNDIKDSWNLSSEIGEINILMNNLAEELKQWASPFEQDGMKRDLILIKGSITQFEKEAINRDIAMIEKSINKYEKGFAKSVSKFIIRVIKKIISVVKVKKD